MGKMGNNRSQTTELSHDDIGGLKAARDHARAIGLDLNTHVTFAPFCEAAAVPLPGDIAATFKRLLTYLGIWTTRHAGVRFTYIRVAHSDEDGTGRNPHLHVFMHLPDAKQRDNLQAAVSGLYGYTTAGGLVAMVRDGFERIRHESGYWISTFDYMTRYKTQQAYFGDGGRSWRASQRDANGRHVGIKCPFVGRRWNVSRNINAKARQSYDGAKGREIVSARIAAERKHLAARDASREAHLASAGVVSDASTN
jgi:hypothetical protein